MARVDVDEYRTKYLKEVQERIIAKKDSVPHYSSKLLNEAILEVINSMADEETWQIDIPDDKEQALKEAEDRILETMKHNKDLGVGRSW